ncbi:hypothetical protein ACFY7C_36825 [Streptomyces sp. NPDC012769]|uniref:hypothetical protein n=1 Tax=Streptomyces sp. NPDC012769 TaxID=3364848 RepID=UPI00369CB27C
MTRLSQTNPELFENPTLGSATTSAFLDQEEAQRVEDYNARIDGREPMTVIAVDRYPKFMEPGSQPSDVRDKLEYVDPNSPVAEQQDLFTQEDFEDE